jgi:hypothetical protein
MDGWMDRLHDDLRPTHCHRNSLQEDRQRKADHHARQWPPDVLEQVQQLGVVGKDGAEVAAGQSRPAATVSEFSCNGYSPHIQVAAGQGRQASHSELSFNGCSPHIQSIFTRLRGTAAAKQNSSTAVAE